MATNSQNGEKTSRESVKIFEKKDEEKGETNRNARYWLTQSAVFPFLLLIRVYQLCISPLLGPKCRFYPTCSAYAEESIRVHGVSGLWMAIKRISRCHPWNPGGYDPVPKKKHHH